MGMALAIVGTVCILYGIAVMLVGSGTWFFAFWFVVGAVVLAASFAVFTGKWDALTSAGRLAVMAVVIVLLAGFGFTQALIMQDFSDEGEPGLDYIIVLGAQVRDTGPSPVLQFRLDTACRYLKDNPGTMCIVSGGQGSNEHTAEANVMADYLVEHGIDSARIICEDRAENTSQNIAFSMAFFDPAHDSVGIVTNNFHVYRSLKLARKADIAHVCGIAAGSTPFYLPNNMVRESLGIAKDFLAGNL